MNLSRSEKYCVQLRKEKKESYLKGRSYGKSANAEHKDDEDWESMFEPPKADDEFNETLDLILYLLSQSRYSLKPYEQTKMQTYLVSI